MGVGGRRRENWREGGVGEERRREREREAEKEERTEI